MSRIPVVLAAPPALLVARALPPEGAALGLRLAAATLCLLIPGALAARVLRLRGVAATLMLSLALVAGALGVMFLLEESVAVALAALGGLAVGLLPLALLRRPSQAVRGAPLVFLLGAGFGAALWWVAAPVEGDGLFHLARVRKLDAFDALTLERVVEFEDGGLHPGYAFPLWHGFLALVARLADVDPTVVIRHEASVLAPLAFVVVYEAGVSLFRSAWPGFAVLAAHVGATALAPGSGGAYAYLGLPATASRQLLVPAVLAVVFAHLNERSVARLLAIAAGALALALVHPTYAVFLCLPLAGFVVARALLSRADLLRLGTALVAVAAPTAGVALALLPLVRDTVPHTPSAREVRRGLAHYAGQIEVFSETSYRLAAGVFGRSGAVAVAALILVPLAAFASRRRWAAFVLGGSLAVFAVTLVRFAFPHFADLVTLSQARRTAGFVPLAFAFAGGVGLLAQVLRWGVLPVALAAGVALQHFYPGDFGYTFEGLTPPLPAWIAAIGGAVALVAARLLRRWIDLVERRGVVTALAAALFVTPVAVDAAMHWEERAPGRPGLSGGLVTALRDEVRPGDVVFSDLETSYRIGAYAPVYIAAAPTGHVAATLENRPFARRRDVEQFLRSGDLSIPARYGARWIVLNRRRSLLRLPLERVYADERYALYRLG